MYGRVDRHACPRRGVGWKEEEAEDEYTEDGAEEECEGIGLLEANGAHWARHCRRQFCGAATCRQRRVRDADDA